MESLLKPVTLSPDVDRILQEIRTGTENALYGASSAESEELFAKHVLSLVEGAGLPVLQVMHYRWFLRELARLWRTRQGRDLAFHLELCIRKWVGLGLEPRTLQFLVCESYERLKAKQPAQPQSAQSTPSQSVETAKDGDMTEIGSGISDRVPSPEPDSTTKTQRHEEEETTAKDAKFAKPGSDPATRLLESSNPGILSVESSTPGILESWTPCV